MKDIKPRKEGETGFEGQVMVDRLELALLSKVDVDGPEYQLFSG